MEQYFLLDCRENIDGEIAAIGGRHEIEALSKQRNAEVGAKTPVWNGTRFYWPFMWTSMLSDNDCREDLLAIQRAKLARFHASKPAAPRGAQLALFVEA